MAGQRGYTSGKEHAKGRTEGDLKEFWHFGQYNKHPDSKREQLPENISVKKNCPNSIGLGKSIPGFGGNGCRIITSHCPLFELRRTLF